MFFLKHTRAQEEEIEYIEGTRCPQAPEGMASYCGQINTSMPVERTDKSGNKYLLSGQPIKGVSVYIYECNEDSPTCKINGELVNPFASTSTNEEGLYHITMRKVGNKKRRYIVFACGDNVKKTYRIPSFADNYVFSQFIDCPEVNTYVAPTNSLLYANRKDQLSCQMGSELAVGEGEARTLEAGYTENDIAHSVYVEGKKAPDTTVNFYVHLEGADPRFDAVVEEDPLLKWTARLFDFGLEHTPIPNFAYGTYPDGTPKLGAFWSKDCVTIYGSDGLEGNTTAFDDLFEDDEELSYWCFDETNPSEIYNDNLWVIQNKFPTIPPANRLLMYREYSPRQNPIEVATNPTAGALFNQTHFGNCARKVFLRYQNQEKEDDWMSCEELKNCISVYGSGSPLDSINAFTTGGYARNQMIPFEHEKRVEMLDLDTKICKIEGKEEPVKLSEIEPPKSWDMHEDKEYILDYTYFNPEIVYLFGYFGRTGKVGIGFESQNDSATEALSHNKVIFGSTFEGEDLPQKGGTAAIHTNGGKQEGNNSIGAAAEIAGGEISGMEPLTNIYTIPYETEEQKELVTKGLLKIIDLSEGIDHCLRSKVNSGPAQLVMIPEDDRKLWINNDYRGNPDHHPLDFLNPSKPTSAGEDNEHKETRTPTSALFFTSVAKDRAKYLNDVNNRYTGNEIYDHLLTSIYGEGFLNWKSLTVGAVINSLFESLKNIEGESDRKTFADITDRFAVNEVRDSLEVWFDLSEENFTTEFPLPDPNGSLLPDDWGPGHECYEWHDLDSGEVCGTYKEDGGISRTCRVNGCASRYIAKQCICQEDLRNGEIFFDCTTNDPEDRVYRVGEELGVVLGRLNVSLEEYLSTQSGTTSYLEGEACPLASRYSCAVSQKDCIQDGDANGSCAGDEMSSMVTSCENKEGSNVQKIQNMDVWIETGYAASPACDLSRAGPYTCSGDLYSANTPGKDTNLYNKQEEIDEPNTLTSVKTNGITVTDNYRHRLISLPYSPDSTYFNGAELGADTSADTYNDITEDYGYEMINYPGATGISNMNMQTLALPTIFNASPEYEEIYYHCVNPELGSTTGPWECPVLPVPDPEIIDLDTLDIDSSCGVNLTDNCMALLGIENPSDTFVKILGAAATQYNVPASVLLAYMDYIHKTYESPTYTWYYEKQNEESLINASLPWYGTFDEFDCNETEKQAIGPYDWIEKWFDAAVENTTVKADIDKISEGRSETLSRCNFLDATYVVAADLGKDYISSCSAWTIEDVNNAIMALVWGNEPIGKNADQELGAKQINVFNACR